MGLLSYEQPFCRIVGSVTRLYRSCSIRDTRDDDYRREGRRNGSAARSRKSNQKKENLGEVPSVEKRRR